LIIRCIASLFATVAVVWLLSACGSGDSGTSAQQPSETAGATKTPATANAAFHPNYPPLKVPGHKPIPVITVRPSLTKAHYIARANAICKESIEQMKKSVRAQGLGSYFERSEQIYLPSMQFWFDDIDYLGAPLGDAGQVEAMMRAVQVAVWRGQERGVYSGQQMAALFSKFSRMARHYGLDRCVVRSTFPT
jgi:hypothetical protein